MCFQWYLFYTSVSVDTCLCTRINTLRFQKNCFGSAACVRGPMLFHVSEVSNLRISTSTKRLIVALAIVVLGGVSLYGAPCETGAATVIGSPTFGATVSTFSGLGVDPTVTCIENSLWSNPVNFGLGTYVKGAEGWGTGVDNLVLGSYNTAGSAAANANALDHAWVQDTSGSGGLPGGIVGDRPSLGIIWDLGGQANKAAVFVFVDHGPVPGEVLENTAWLSNDPNAADGDWTQAFLTHVYGYGFEDDSTSISDGFVAVYSLPDPTATFRYVSVTWGGPGAIVRDGDNEIDAVGGLKADDTGVGDTVPEPSTYASMGGGLALLLVGLRRRKK
jgi:hypothetical protein